MAPNHTDYYGTAVHTLAYPVMTSMLDNTDIGTELDFCGEAKPRTPPGVGGWGGVLQGASIALKGLTERGLYLRHNDWQIWITIVDQWISCGTKPTFFSVIFCCWVGDYLGEGEGLIHDHITVTHTVKKTQFYTQNRPMCCLQFFMLIITCHNKSNRQFCRFLIQEHLYTHIYWHILCWLLLSVRSQFL